MSKRTTDEVLRYTQTAEVSRSTIRRHYLRWRSEHSPTIPVSCDNPECRFAVQPLKWNGRTLPLILDHVNGCNTDNRVKNLRLLCPNCDSQLSTRGGGNKGRVEKASGGFALVRPDGLKDYHLPTEPARLQFTPNTVEFYIKKDKD